MIHKHRVYFYETDAMGCVYHSNYIHWFEEARIAHMDNMGFPYSKLEASGIGSPVLEVEAKYRSMTRFDDIVLVEAKIEIYTGTRIVYAYTVTDEKTGVVRCTGKTSHCFLTHDGKVVSLKRNLPELDEIIEAMPEFVNARTEKKKL